jgi:hypothetical protein
MSIVQMRSPVRKSIEVMRTGRWGRRPTRRGDAIRASETLAIRDRSHTRLKRSSDTGASAETKTSPRPQSARSGSWREEPEECSHRKSRRRRNVLADRKRRSCPNANLNLRLRLREPHRLPLLSFIDANNTKIDAMAAGLWKGADAAGAMADNLTRAGNAAGAAGGGGGGGGGAGKRGSSFTLWHGDQVYDEYKLDENGNIVKTTNKERQQQMRQAHIGMLNQQAKQDQVQDFLSGFDWDRFKQTGDRGVYFPVDRYAEGGYVTEPTNAIIGEGDDSEYVIPSGKMNEAMRRYGSGMRGSSVIPDSADVTVNYNGSTVDMGGSNYVNQGDVSGIVNKAVNATLTKLRSSSRARLNAGV